MSVKYAGQCLCGEIRYEADGEPLFAGNCHCKDCQRSSGSAFIPAMMFRADDVVIAGAVRYFAHAAGNGHTHERGFCPRCGSQLFTRLSRLPGVLGIKAGTLDDASHYVPQLDFHAASAAPWDAMDPALPKKPGPAQG